ncbi:MAG: hypothetical protein IPN22_04095 [Bacteroidetes bacterium]|nr:hypothetical protein [Bacteroidota bacterium]
MHLAKLCKTLQALDKPAMQRLLLFARSPYFKTPDAAVQLLAYMADSHPAFTEKKINPTAIARKISQLTDAKKQSNAATMLLRTLQHFISIEHWQQQPLAIDLAALQGWQKLGMADNLHDSAEQLRTKTDNQPEQDLDAFLYRHLCTETMHNGYMARLTRNTHNDLLPVVSTLDAYYAIKKLRYHCELISRHLVVGTAYQPDNLPYLLQVLQPFTNEQYPYVLLFVNTYQMLAAASFEESVTHYLVLKNLFDHNDASSLSPSLRECFAYLENHLLYWANKGVAAAQAEQMWCLNTKIKLQMILQHGKILPAEFRNPILTAIKNNCQPSWIRTFIDTYGPALPPEQAATNLAFAEALYQYAARQYHLAMPLFQQAQVKNEPIFNAIVRRWQFMCLYEQNPHNHGPLFDFLDAYDKYLTRNAAELHRYLPVFHRFIKYAHKLWPAANQKQAEKNLKELQAEDFFAGKDWLLLHLQNKTGG